MAKKINISSDNDFYDVLFLGIEITTYCNLNCSMCFKRGIIEQPKKHMSFEEFKQILKLRRENPKPENYCKVCGIRFCVFC